MSFVIQILLMPFGFSVCIFDTRKFNKSYFITNLFVTYFLQDYRYYDDLVTTDNNLDIELIVLGELDRNYEGYKIRGYLRYGELKKYCDTVIDIRSNGEIPIIRNETFWRIIRKYEGQFLTRKKVSRKGSRIYPNHPAIERYIKMTKARNLESKYAKYIKARILKGPSDTVSSHIVRETPVEYVPVPERLSAVVGYADGKPNKII
ncbi:MAG TPA: hypothetical protein VKA09_04795 [Nitrososphaeraceae archaeon]|nr:hypothetical protein [Nitrososphaeraceae archaeon]